MFLFFLSNLAINLSYFFNEQHITLLRSWTVHRPSIYTGKRKRKQSVSKLQSAVAIIIQVVLLIACNKKKTDAICKIFRKDLCEKNGLLCGKLCTLCDFSFSYFKLVLLGFWRTNHFCAASGPVLTCGASISINIRIRGSCISEDSCSISISISFLLMLMLTLMLIVQCGHHLHKHKVLADWLIVLRLCFCQHVLTGHYSGIHVNISISIKRTQGFDILMLMLRLWPSSCTSA